ncbi:unnamed protein product, partial [Nesidiocoris tenuis]
MAWSAEDRGFQFISWLGVQRIADFSSFHLAECEGSRISVRIMAWRAEGRGFQFILWRGVR